MREKNIFFQFLNVLTKSLFWLISTDISPIFMIGFNSVGDLNENENDQFVTRLNDSNKNCEVCSTNYKSFHNGAAFFISNPLFESFVELCRVDNMTRIKLGRLLSIENFQCLRVKLGIITLKKMLAFICSKQSIVSARNIDMLNRNLFKRIQIPSLLILFSSI